jgi:ketopantoate reductase
MKVAVVGAGVIGCLSGGRLAETGHDVVRVLFFWEGRPRSSQTRPLREI